MTNKSFVRYELYSLYVRKLCNVLSQTSTAKSSEDFSALVTFFVRGTYKSLSNVCPPIFVSPCLSAVGAASLAQSCLWVDTTLKHLPFRQVSVHCCITRCHSDSMKCINPPFVLLSLQHCALCTVLFHYIVHQRNIFFVILLLRNAWR